MRTYNYMFKLTGRQITIIQDTIRQNHDEFIKKYRTKQRTLAIPLDNNERVRIWIQLYFPYKTPSNIEIHGKTEIIIQENKRPIQHTKKLREQDANDLTKNTYRIQWPENLYLVQFKKDLPATRELRVQNTETRMETKKQALTRKQEHNNSFK